MADNKVVDVLEYNIENTEIEVPEVPAKSGYTAKWEEFNLVPPPSIYSTE